MLKTTAMCNVFLLKTTVTNIFCGHIDADIASSGIVIKMLRNLGLSADEVAYRCDLGKTLIAGLHDHFNRGQLSI